MYTPAGDIFDGRYDLVHHLDDNLTTMYNKFFVVLILFFVIFLIKVLVQTTTIIKALVHRDSIRI